jgi:AraC-like DNA-binding protein
MEAAHKAANVEIIPVGSEPLTGRSVRLELDSMWVEHVFESAPRLKHVNLSSTRAFTTFIVKPGPEVIKDGIELRSDGVVRHSVGSSFFERTTGPTHWGVVSIPIDRVDILSMMAGRDLAPPRMSLIVIPPKAAFDCFLRLHEAAVTLAEHAPAVLTSSEAALGLEASLIECLCDLAEGETVKECWTEQCHSIVMQRFRRLLEDSPDTAIYLPETCVTIGVSQRTLRYCCQEQLGMSPKRYLVVRRLHLAQRALSAAVAGETTVTEIATEFGFWHLGRFSCDYKSLFGESPSDTLARELRQRAVQGRTDEVSRSGGRLRNIAPDAARPVTGCRSFCA